MRLETQISSRSFFDTLKRKKAGLAARLRIMGQGYRKVFLLNGHALSGLSGMVPCGAAIIEGE